MYKEEFTVKIKPLTSIWTGDENRKNTTLRETGIIGSLRWWYEALVRGLEGSACEPTSDKKDEKCPDKNGKHCDACELFGCTGWARKFRLEVEFNNTIPDVWIGTREKRRNQYLKRNIAGFISDRTINLKFIPLREITQNEWALLNKTLQIIADYGALGAHTSQGNGVIKIIENNLPCRDKKPEKLKKSDNSVELPNMDNFFFYKFHIEFKEDISKLIDNEVFWTHASDHGFKDDFGSWKKLWNDYHFLPIAFHIRDAIRLLESDRSKRHIIFGIGGGDAQGSRVFVSHAYRIDDKTVEVRCWGYNVEKNIKNKIKGETLEGLK